MGRNKPPPESNEEEVKEEEDIFGSEQSQIDLKELDPEEEEDYPLLPPNSGGLAQVEKQESEEDVEDLEESLLPMEMESNTPQQITEKDESKAS